MLSVDEEMIKVGSLGYGEYEIKKHSPTFLEISSTAFGGFSIPHGNAGLSTHDR